MKKISVVTVVYNDSVNLSVTIDSLTKQSYKDFEFIVIDGGSTDGTLDVIKKADNISHYLSERDFGIYDAMNKGLNICSGEWVLFLNAGDVLYEHETLDLFLNNIHPSFDVIYGDVLLSGLERKKKQSHSLIYLLRYNLCHQSMIIKKSALMPSGYDLSYPISSDNAFLVKNYLDIRFKKIDKIVSVYDLNGVSSQTLNKKRIWLEKVSYYKDSELTLFKKCCFILFCYFMFLFR